MIVTSVHFDFGQHLCRKRVFTIAAMMPKATNVTTYPITCWIEITTPYCNCMAVWPITITAIIAKKVSMIGGKM